MRLLLTLTLLMSACTSKEQAPEPTIEAPPAAPAPKKSANGISWHQDDYPGALAEARKQNKPLLIDMWAQWCHTCLSMQHYVLADPGLAPHSARFVWLSIDTELETNAPVLGKFPLAVWPTFFVISPGDESIQARYPGSASLAQFREFLDAGERGHQDVLARGGRLKKTDPLYIVRQAERAAIAGDLNSADARYMAALATAPADWPRRPDVLVSAIGARSKAGRKGDCVDLALTGARHTGNTASAADFLSYAGACADDLDPTDRRRKALNVLAIGRLRALLDDSTAPLSLDDRSDAMAILRGFLQRVGDKKRAHALALAQRMLLDQAARDALRALGAHAASTYNWPRAEVYVYLGVARELVADLRASEEALPDNYDPPYRLAWVQLKTGDHDAALKAAKRALELSKGPRKARIRSLIADIKAARSEREAKQ